MVSFSSLKKSSADIGRLTKEIEKLNGANYNNADDRYWKPTLDKAGNGYAVIRFLPGPEVDGDDALPWVRLFSHGFKGPTGKWYIENSLTSLDPPQKDPVGELNSVLYNSSDDKDSPARKQASAQKRRLHYISNIYVVADPKSPENEGKIFLFKYGQKIFEKITEAMNPPFDDQGRDKTHPQYNPTNQFIPFDLFSGANFKLTVKSIAQPDGKKFPNYDSSTWATPGPWLSDEAEMERLWKTEYSLKEVIHPKNFKSYDELKRRLTDVLGEQGGNKPTASRIIEDNTDDDDVPFRAAATQRKSVVNDEVEDDDMAYFNKLADE